VSSLENSLKNGTKQSQLSSRHSFFLIGLSIKISSFLEEIVTPSADKSSAPTNVEVQSSVSVLPEPSVTTELQLLASETATSTSEATLQETQEQTTPYLNTTSIPTTSTSTTTATSTTTTTTTTTTV
jgi:hypothetical protein